MVLTFAEYGEIVVSKPERKPEYKLPSFIESKDDSSRRRRPAPEITRTVLDLHASQGKKVAFGTCGAML